MRAKQREREKRERPPVKWISRVNEYSREEVGRQRNE